MITNILTYFHQSKSLFLLLHRPRCGNAPLPSLGLKKKAFGGFHLVITVVDDVCNSQAHTSVQNVVVHEQVSSYYNNIFQSCSNFAFYSYVLPNGNAGTS
jgi:hypothetical protein